MLFISGQGAAIDSSTAPPTRAVVAIAYGDIQQGRLPWRRVRLHGQDLGASTAAAAGALGTALSVMAADCQPEPKRAVVATSTLLRP